MTITAVDPSALFDYHALGDHTADITFLDSRGTTASLTYRQLAERARRAAGALLARGLRRGDRVLLPLGTGPDHLAALWGCLLTGLVPCTIVVPPSPGDDSATGTRQFRAVVTVTEPAAVITADSATAAALATEGGPQFLTVADLRHPPATDEQLTPPHPDDAHHIQLTSGSTSAPKAAVLTYAQVTANVRAIHQALELDAARDRSCHWLPLHHDMGFILTLSTLTRGVPLDLMPSISFLRDPLSWLRHISQRGATITTAPPFGYRTATERFRRTPDTDLDLSTLRQAYVGAEPIPLQVLTDFRDTFAGQNLGEDVVIPCYGMAETVLAATMSLDRRPPGSLSWGRVKALRLDREDLHHHDKVTDATGDRPSITVIACGRPLGGLTVHIRTPDGAPCGDNEIGEIHLHGDSVMAGYLSPGGAPTLVSDRTHATGDLGFTRDGDLYVVGRVKELLIVNGRNLPPYDVEETIETHPDIDAGNSAVFSCTDDNGEHVVAVIETRLRAEEHPRVKREAAMAVRRAFGFNLHEVIVLRRGGIPRTTSGKRQRGRLRDDYLTGRLA
ncbi:MULTISPECIES: AMP-binding protein [Streptomyces]|uniref:AMP-binding protein n=1 Tax=Streptomyces TaxID=1883 RepID=UPI0013188DC6|nr:MULTISPECIES: AMP-binding protein [Streptomyces]QGZ47190.1 AMP-binding protein [Streptomyces sp. QHH-9511]GGU01371.1 AMP-dependent synthetase and ligase [Streptomyces lateritius]